MDITTFIILIVIVFIVCLLYEWWCNKKRREAFQKWADIYHWQYDFRESSELYKHYSFLSKLCQGSNRYAFDYLYGQWKGYDTEAFNFHYETYSYSSNSNGGSSRTTHHHYLGVVLIPLKSYFPKLVIHSRGIWGKVFNIFEFGVIELDSVEFNQRFKVYCQDKKFSYDFCHTRMMGYLLAYGDIKLELSGCILAIYQEGIMQPEELEIHLTKLCQIRKLMPRFLFRS